MLIYLAGPLFSEAERAFNFGLCHRLEAAGLSVFLPQRDGVERDKPEYKDLPKEEKRRMLFDLDTVKVIESDIFLFILDGRVPDEGACVELGLAYGDKRFNKPEKMLIGLMTDSQAAFVGGKLNPMIGQALHQIFDTCDDLVTFLVDSIGKDNPVD